MKVALLITTFNRSEYLKQCLQSLWYADLSQISDVIIIDDYSTDSETISILNRIGIDNPKWQVRSNGKNIGIKKSLLWAYDYFFGISKEGAMQKHGFDIIINLDGDALVRHDFVHQLLSNYKKGTLLTGFHSTTRSANGSERHIILNENKNTYFKQSVGGINMCIDREAYEKYMKPALELVIATQGNHDHQACINSGGCYCLKESVIEHIGFDSSMNHHENPDTADSFYFHRLKDVTLLGVDNNSERLHKAVETCTKRLKFGAVVELNPDIRSKEAYSDFIVNEAYKHITTSHVLIIQHDGYVINPCVWNEDWLQYDYIGATWWYNEGVNVGNGGFSLRSKRLMELISTDPIIQQSATLHPEDHVICRVHGEYLQKVHGIKFAPEDVAELFSFEGYMQPHKPFLEPFGIHGQRAINLANGVPKKRTGRKLVFNQFLSLGDILFLVPMYRALIEEGNEVLWPIDERYLSIRKHFPDVNFVNKTHYNLPYDTKGVVDTPFGKLLPYRYANELMQKTLHTCMENKYQLFGHDYNMWRSLSWMRDRKAEAKLIEMVHAHGDFILVNRTFGHEAKHTITPDIKSNLRVIEMHNIEGFTLIDWLGVLERAKEAHMSNSSMNYLIELLNLDIEVHLYPRKIWNETLFEYTANLWRNKCFIFHQ